MNSRKKVALIISLVFILFIFASIAFYDYYYIAISNYKFPGGENVKYLRERLYSGLLLLPIVHLPIVFSIIGLICHFKKREYAENFFYLLSCYFLNQLTFCWLNYVGYYRASFFKLGYIKIYSLIPSVLCFIPYILIIARQVVLLLPSKNGFYHKKVSAEVLKSNNNFVIRGEFSYIRYYLPFLLGFFHFAFLTMRCGYFWTNWYSNLLIRADEYKYFVSFWLETVILLLPFIMLLFKKTFGKGRYRVGLRNTIKPVNVPNDFIYEMDSIFFNSTNPILLCSINEIPEEHFINKNTLRKYLREHNKEWIIVEK